MNNLATSTQTQEINTPNNIVGLIPDTLYNRIMSFINDYESDSTKNNYTRYFKKMFMYMANKDMEQLNYNDIKTITKQRVKDYRIFLKESYVASSINPMIFSCKALWDDFMENDIVVGNPFDLKPLKQKDNHYGSLTLDEIDKLFEYCLSLNYKPNTQKLYFQFLFVVTCRKNVAQTITWKDINKELDIETGTMLWVVTFSDKGKDIKKAITDQFYDVLRENYINEKGRNDRLFSIDNETYDKTLKEFCKKYEIAEDRNIVQHSIKGSSLDAIQNIIGDINVTAMAAQHTNIQTSYSRYLNKNNKFSSQPSYMLHKNYSVDTLRGLGEDTLIKLIEGAGKETLMRICLELEKVNG